MAIQTETQLYVKKTKRNGVAMIYYVPMDLTLSALLALGNIDPEKWGWKEYGVDATGLDTSCGAPTPTIGPPVWGPLTPPTMNPGGYWEWTIPGTAWTPATGQLRGPVNATGRPDFMGQNNLGDGGVKLYGNIPGTLTVPVVLSVSATQVNDNGGATGSATVAVTIPVGSTTLRAIYRYSTGDDKLTVWLGPDAGAQNLPFVTNTRPNGQVGDRLQMREFTAIDPATNVVYYYMNDSYTAPPKGTHQFRFEQLGQILYGSAVVGTVDTGIVVITLSTTAPAPPAVQQGVAEFADARWVRTVPGDPFAENRMFTWFKLTQGADIVLQFRSGDTGNYSTMTGNLRISNDPRGATHRFDINGYTTEKQYYRFKAVGQPDSAYAEFMLTVPSGASNVRSQVWPGVIDPGVPAGVASRQIVSSNPEVFAPVVQWNNGKARIVSTATPQIPAGETLYIYIGGQTRLTALPTTYDLNPGDEVAILMGTYAVEHTNWTKKAAALIQIGNPPTN